MIIESSWGANKGLRIWLLFVWLLFICLLSSCLNENAPVKLTPIVPKNLRAIDQMTTQELVHRGEELLFGVKGKSRTGRITGKAQCPVCHAFRQGQPSTRAPSLWGITARIRTTPTALDYLAESHVCPSCYVVAGWGVTGSQGCESPMPRVHLPPIDLTIEELIAIDTWMYVNEGETPPEPQIIQRAYQNLLSEQEWTYVSRDLNKSLDDDISVETSFYEYGCVACHTIPGIPGATGKIGPILNMQITASARLQDPAYTGNALSPREYIVESILYHDRYLVPEYATYPQNTLHSSYYENKIKTSHLDRMVGYLARLKHDIQPESPRDDAITRCLRKLRS